MNIKEIVDKITRVSDVNPNEYKVLHRLEDVNAEYLKLIKVAGIIGAKFPVSNGTDNNYEDFTLVAGDNTFTRTIADRNIQKVKYRVDSNAEWECLDHDEERCKGCYASVNVKFTANQKQIFVEDAKAGDLRVVYDYSGVTLFTQADYDTTPTPPSPDWLDATFHPLLWLRPTILQLDKHDKKRQTYQDMYDELYELFEMEFDRQSVFDSEIQTDERRSLNKY